MEAVMTSHNKITLIFIVNGVDVPVEANIHEPLKVARNKALTDSNNTGRPMDEWEIHNDAGQALDPDKKIEDLGLADGARLFLNLKVAAGGTE
jgi:hypothetical protein